MWKIAPRIILDVTAERNKILKTWDTLLLPLFSYFKQIFDGCQDVRLAYSLVTKGFFNRKRNEFLKIIICFDK